MNKKVLHVLEYDKIMERLTEKATSEQGRKLTSSLVPMTDLEAINQAQTETADALGYLFRKGSTSFGGNKDLPLSWKMSAVSRVMGARNGKTFRPTHWMYISRVWNRSHCCPMRFAGVSCPKKKLPMMPARI